MLIIYAWFFPWGLLEAVGWNHDSDYITVYWLPYIALTVAALFSRTRVLYFTYYVILCILLALNAAGCQQMNAKSGPARTLGSLGGLAPGIEQML